MKLRRKIIHINDIAKRAIELAEQGMTQEEIARKLGTSQPTVSRLLAGTPSCSCGKGRRKGSKSASMREDAKQNLLAVANAVLAEPAATLQEIATTVGVSPETARRVLEGIACFLKLSADEVNAAERALKTVEADETVEADAIGRAALVDLRETAAQLRLAGVEDSLLLVLAKAARERWESCTAGAWGIAQGVLKSRYYRTAASLLRLLRRLAPSGSVSVAEVTMNPGEVTHPVPRMASKKFTRSAIERAAKAQARHERAGVAVAPGQAILTAYYILRTSRSTPRRNALIAALLAHAVEKHAVISAEATIEDIVKDACLAFWHANKGSARKIIDKVYREYSNAIKRARAHAFVLGRKALRGAVKKEVLAWAGMAIHTFGATFDRLLPGTMPLADYFASVKAEVAAAAEFFPQDPPPPPPQILVRRWLAQNRAAERAASLAAPRGTGKLGKGGGVQDVNVRAAWQAVRGQ